MLHMCNMLFKFYGTVYGTLEALRKRKMQPVVEQRTRGLSWRHANLRSPPTVLVAVRTVLPRYLAPRWLALGVFFYVRQVVPSTYAPLDSSGAGVKTRKKRLDFLSLPLASRWPWPRFDAHLQLFLALVRLLRSQNRLDSIIPASRWNTELSSLATFGPVTLHLKHA